MRACGCELRFNGHVLEKEYSWVEMVFLEIREGFSCLHRAGLYNTDPNSRQSMIERRLINILDPLERYIPEMPIEDAHLMLHLASVRIIALYQNWAYDPSEEDTAAAA
jgi:hypothetical protein